MGRRRVDLSTITPCDPEILAMRACGHWHHGGMAPGGCRRSTTVPLVWPSRTQSMVCLALDVVIENIRSGANVVNQMRKDLENTV